MARETISLDFTPAPAGEEYGHNEPFLPGYQVAHLADPETGALAYQVRRITHRVSARDAARGIAEQYHVYPQRFATIEEATAAAKVAFAADGPGDAGDGR